MAVQRGVFAAVCSLHDSESEREGERVRSGARMVQEGVPVLIRSLGRGGGSRVEELGQQRGIPITAEVEDDDDRRAPIVSERERGEGRARARVGLGRGARLARAVRRER